MISHNLIFILIFMTLAACRNNYYSVNDFGSVRKIDAHAHILNGNGLLEEQAARDDFLLIIVNVDEGDPIKNKELLEKTLLSVKNNPDRVFYGATFFFDTAGWNSEDWSRKIISQLESDISHGAVAVKIWKNIGMTLRDRTSRFIMADDPGLDPLIRFIISKKLPLTAHLGEPLNCWLPLDQMTIRGDSIYFSRHPEYHMYLHPECPSYNDQINARDNLLEKNPDLGFIGCHLGSLEWNIDSLALRLDRFPNMAVDMAARIVHLQYQTVRNHDGVRDFCIKYQDRLLYGTDLHDAMVDDPDQLKKYVHDAWTEDWKYFTSDELMTSVDFKGQFKGLKLPVEVIDKIYYKNAVSWYKLNID